MPGVSPLATGYNQWQAVQQAQAALPRPLWEFLTGAFGPLSPLAPMPIDQPEPGTGAEDAGRPSPRRWQYPVGWNLPVGQPGSEGIKLLPFSTMRGLGDQYSVVRAMLNIRVNEMAGLTWDVGATVAAQTATKGDKGAGQDQRERANQIVKWFNHIDSNYRGFQSWFTAVVEEQFVTDSVAAHLLPPRMKGKGLFGASVAEVEHIDGTTIRPLLDTRGASPRPPAPAYQQYLWGVPRVDLMGILTDEDLDIMEDEYGDSFHQDEFTNDQLLYLPRLKRVWTPYGFSAIEQAVLPITLGMQRQGFLLDFFTEGTIPGVYVIAGDQYTTPAQQRQLQDTLNALAGDTAWKHRVIVLPPGSKTDPQKDLSWQKDVDQIIMDQVQMILHIQPHEIGTLPGGRSSGLGGKGQSETAQSSLTETRTEPDRKWWKTVFLDWIIQDVFGQEDLEWKWLDFEEEEDQLQRAQAETAFISIGRQSIDEARIEAGQDPWNLPLTKGPVLISGGTIVPLDPTVPAPAPPGGGLGGMLGLGGVGPDGAPIPGQPDPHGFPPPKDAADVVAQHIAGQVLDAGGGKPPEPGQKPPPGAPGSTPTPVNPTAGADQHVASIVANEVARRTGKPATSAKPGSAEQPGAKPADGAPTGQRTPFGGRPGGAAQPGKAKPPFAKAVIADLMKGVGASHLDYQGDLAKVVYRYLLRSYPKDAVKWVKDGDWTFERHVPLDQINMARRPGGRDPEKVSAIADTLDKGASMDPIVLVERQDQSKYLYDIADGWHRTLGAEEAGVEDLPAFIGSGFDDKADWGLEMQDVSDSKKKAARAELAQLRRYIRNGRPIEKFAASSIDSDVMRLLADELPSPEAWRSAERRITKGPGNPQALRDWFNEGADGQIDWGQDGDFMQCVGVASAHMSDEDAKGFCNLRHQDATGGAPGTEKALALVKYSDTQPRVPAGSSAGGEFASADGGDNPGFAGPEGPLKVPTDPVSYPGGYNPNNTPLGMLTANDKLYWVAASRERLQSIRDNAGTPGTIGYKMLVEMATGIPTTVPIYRGIRQSMTGGAYTAASYKPGQTVDLQLSSFSTSRDEALAYARNEAGRTGESSTRAFGPLNSALIVVEPGAAGLDIGPTFRGNPGNEVITAGRYEVVSNEMHDVGMALSGLNGQVQLTGTLPVITLRQVAVIEPQSGKHWDAADWRS